MINSQRFSKAAVEYRALTRFLNNQKFKIDVKIKPARARLKPRIRADSSEIRFVVLKDEVRQYNSNIKKADVIDTDTPITHITYNWSWMRSGVKRITKRYIAVIEITDKIARGIKHF